MKHTHEELEEWTSEPTVEISCSKCNNRDEAIEYDCHEHLFKVGWRATAKNVYCPTCAKKYLK